MPGIATVLVPSGPAGKKIHLYYTTNGNNLAFEFRNEVKDHDTAEIFTSSSDDLTGTILNPGQISSSVLSGAQFVVGFTKKKADPNVNPNDAYDPKLNNVSVISPIYYAVDSTETDNLTIASCSSADDAWAYYFTGTDEPLLTEANITNGSVTPQHGTIKILPGSSLAAYYDDSDDARYVIVQSADHKTFYEYNNDGDDTQLRNTGDAKPGTSIAVAYYDGKSYLYYTDSSNELRFVTKANGKWGHSDSVKGSSVDADSQLTVVNNGRTNHLFYVAKKDPKTKISHVAHKV